MRERGSAVAAPFCLEVSTKDVTETLAASRAPFGDENDVFSADLLVL